MVKKYRVIFANANLTTTGLAADSTDFGDYYAWGATEPWYTSISTTSSSVTVSSWKTSYPGGYTPDNYSTYIGTNTIVGNGVLKTNYDAARKQLGGDWQIPTKDILEKLQDDISYSKVNIHNVDGIKFSNNGAELFLPLAGEFNNGDWRDSILSGCYWSNTIVGSNTSAYVLEFLGDIPIIDEGSHYCGFNIRPVRLVEVYE